MWRTGEYGRLLLVLEPYLSNHLGILKLETWDLATWDLWSWDLWRTVEKSCSQFLLFNLVTWLVWSYIFSCSCELGSLWSCALVNLWTCELVNLSTCELASWFSWTFQILNFFLVWAWSYINVELVNNLELVSDWVITIMEGLCLYRIEACRILWLM